MQSNSTKDGKYEILSIFCGKEVQSMRFWVCSAEKKCNQINPAFPYLEEKTNYLVDETWWINQESGEVKPGEVIDTGEHLIGLHEAELNSLILVYMEKFYMDHENPEGSWCLVSIWERKKLV